MHEAGMLKDRAADPSTEYVMYLTVASQSKRLMRTFLILPVSLLFIIQCQAQTALKAPYHFQSYAYGLYVTKSEQLIVTTRVGEVAIAGSLTSLWRKADPEAKDNSTGFRMGQTFDQPNFFNNDTGFVSGFVKSGGDKYDIIYHTTNGGKN